MARHIDFDAIWAEYSEHLEAPTATVHGETVTLPASCPVAVTLLVNRLRDPDTRNQVDLEEVTDVLAIVFGRPAVDRWVLDGIGQEKLGALVISLPGFWGEGHAGQEPADVS